MHAGLAREAVDDVQNVGRQEAEVAGLEKERVEPLQRLHLVLQCTQSPKFFISFREPHSILLFLIISRLSTRRLCCKHGPADFSTRELQVAHAVCQSCQSCLQCLPKSCLTKINFNTGVQGVGQPLLPLDRSLNNNPTVL